jgi:hypothetical protein
MEHFFQISDEPVHKLKFAQVNTVCDRSVSSNSTLKVAFAHSFCVDKGTRCGFEVSGMILFQASYLYTYSLLRGITFEVFPFSSYALSPTMLLLLEFFFFFFFDFLFWNSLQCRRHNFYVFIILKSLSLYGRLCFENIEKSFGAKSRE